jgi:hypothetical protein
MKSKEQLIEAYVKDQLQRMSIDDLSDFFVVRFTSECEDMTKTELLDDILEYAPDLLEEE